MLHLIDLTPHVPSMLHLKVYYTFKYVIPIRPYTLQYVTPYSKLHLTVPYMLHLTAHYSLEYVTPYSKLLLTVHYSLK